MSREMKDSGSIWFGKIPTEWDVNKIKFMFHIKKEIAGKEGYTILSITQRGVIPKDISKNEGQIAESYSKYQHVERGDFAMNHMDLLTGWVDISKYSGVTSPDYRVFVLNDYLKHCSRYYLYMMQMCYSNRIFYGLGQGVSGLGRWRLQADKFLNFVVPIPPFNEQKKIANYLDIQCKEIFTVLDKTRASIEEYKKLKQAVITQAITKGIRSNRSLKDSGIEWIGEMPEEWMLIPFRRVLQERCEKNTPVKSTERLSLSIDLGVTLYSEKTTNLDRFKDDFEQYKLAHEGDLVMNSMNMIVGASGVSDYFGCVSPVYYTFFDDLEDHATAKYCEFIFRSKTMLRVLFSLGKGIYAIVRGEDRVNTCRLKVSKEDLKNIVLPIPKVDEQREIIEYLRAKCAEIDTLIAKKQQFLTELETYKKSLIYEYVTGKKEVH